MPRRTTRRRSRSSTTSTARPPGRLRRCTSTGCRPVGSGRVTWTWLRDAEVPVRDDRIRPPRRVRLHQLAEPGADHAGREVFAGGGGDGDAAAHGGAGVEDQGSEGKLMSRSRPWSPTLSPAQIARGVRISRFTQEEDSMLDKLKNLNLNRSEVDELVALHAFGAGLVGAFGTLDLESPQWLQDSMAMLTKEIKARHEDALEAQLKETESQLDALKTADEKRQDLRAQAARLRAKLGKPGTTTQPASTSEPGSGT